MHSSKNVSINNRILLIKRKQNLVGLGSTIRVGPARVGTLRGGWREYRSPQHDLAVIGGKAEKLPTPPSYHTASQTIFFPYSQVFFLFLYLAATEIKVFEHFLSRTFFWVGGRILFVYLGGRLSPLCWEIMAEIFFFKWVILCDKAKAYHVYYCQRHWTALLKPRLQAPSCCSLPGRWPLWNLVRWKYSISIGRHLRNDTPGRENGIQQLSLPLADRRRTPVAVVCRARALCTQTPWPWTYYLFGSHHSTAGEFVPLLPPVEATH